MSSCKATTAESGPSIGRRAAVRGLTLGLLAAALSGCSGASGFHPVYGSLGTADGSVAARMAKVEVSPIGGNLHGQTFRNELIYQLNGTGGQQEPLYRLECSFSETAFNTLVAADGNSAGGVWQIEVRFQLIRLADKKILLRGSSFGRASYERFSSTFANVRANDDAASRSAKTIANDVRGRVAVALSSEV